MRLFDIHAAIVCGRHASFVGVTVEVESERWPSSVAGLDAVRKRTKARADCRRFRGRNTLLIERCFQQITRRNRFDAYLLAVAFGL